MPGTTLDSRTVIIKSSVVVTRRRHGIHGPWEEEAPRDPKPRLWTEEDEAARATHPGQPREIRTLSAYIHLMRAADSVGKRLEEHLASFELTENQFGILEILLHLGPVIQRELSKKLFTSGGNVTQMLDQLEKRELVKRIRDSQDRRIMQVHLTEKGDRFIRTIFPEHLDAILEEFSVLTSEEQEELARLCKKIGLHLR